MGSIMGWWSMSSRSAALARQSRNASGNCFVLKPVRCGADHGSEEIRIAQAVDLIGSELIWLATERNLDNPDGQLGDETGGDYGAGATPRVVAVKHQRDLLEVLLEKYLLPLRKRASH